MYIILFLIIDQIAKWLAKVNLQSGFFVNVVNNVINFTYVENRGAAFGILTGKKSLIVVLTIIFIFAIGYFYYKHIRNKYGKLIDISLMLIIAGAIGNLIDRIFRGYVIDFIYLTFMDFPVFNIADMYINIGAFLAILCLLFDKRFKEENNDKDKKITKVSRNVNAENGKIKLEKSKVKVATKVIKMENKK